MVGELAGDAINEERASCRWRQEADELMQDDGSGRRRERLKLRRGQLGQLLHLLRHALAAVLILAVTRRNFAALRQPVLPGVRAVHGVSARPGDDLPADHGRGGPVRRLCVRFRGVFTGYLMASLELPIWVGDSHHPRAPPGSSGWSMGLLVVRLKANSLMITIGTMILFRGDRGRPDQLPRRHHLPRGYRAIAGVQDL